MPNYPAISFGLLTPRSLSDFSNVERLFTLWYQMAPVSFPTTFGTVEPLRRKLKFEHLDDLKKCWQLMVHFERTSTPLLAASIAIEKEYSEQHFHSALCASVESAENLDSLLAEFMAEAMAALGGHFGYVHRVNDSEAKMGLETNTCSRYLIDGAYRTLSIFSPQLKRGIPNLFWTTVLGKPCVEAIGRDVINSCPVKRITWVAEEIVLLQLSDSVDDSLEHEDEFEEIRALAKEHLGLKFFQPYCRKPDGHMISFG